MEMTLGAPLTVLSEEEQMFQQSVREFAVERIRPLVHDMDHDAKMSPDLIREFFDLGVMGIEVPDQWGGAGSSFFTAVLVVEELSHVDASCGVIVDVQNTLVNNILLRWGNEDQKSKYLSMLSRDTVGAYALSEAGSGSDAFALGTKAEDKGDHWVLNGQKLWITNAAEAGVFVVFANANPDAGYKGITAFMVERDFPGFTVGKKEDKLGIRASSTCELILEDCHVPKENVVGETGKGYKIAIETLNEGRIGIGAQMVGVARGAWEYAVKYAQERKQFGKAIGDFQGNRWKLADMYKDIETGRSILYRACLTADPFPDPFMAA
ncbi:MAG TPA: acyl-CoA dehydrogenase family protein, partial [Thermoanaerobaculia bacterium]|nr:acyl-CoA dehydrogenase family protein [Thermoanaerobaculia bacterium]